MTREDTERLIGQIGTLRTQCEELRLRNEILQWELERKTGLVRELETELAEWREDHRFRYGNTLLVHRDRESTQGT